MLLLLWFQSMYLNVKYTKGLNDTEGQAECKETGEQDEPGVATMLLRPRLPSPSLHWDVHDDFFCHTLPSFSLQGA